MAGIENATTLNQLNVNNPDGSLDPKSQGDNHIRLLKQVLLNTFPSITGVVSVSHAEINFLQGVTTAVQAAQHKNVNGGIAGLDAGARLLNAQMPTDPSLVTLRLTSVVPADLTSAGQGLQLGASSSFNLALSTAIMQARNNGAGATLSLNSLGGAVVIGKTASDGAIVTNVAGGVDFYSTGAKYGELGVNYFKVGNGLLNLRVRMVGTNAVFENITTSGLLTLQATNSSGSQVAMAIFDPNSTSYLYGSNTPAIGYSYGFAALYGSTQHTLSSVVNGVTLGRITASAGNYQFIAEAGQNLYLYVNNGATYIAGYAIDPSGNPYVNNGGSLQLLSAYIPAIMNGTPNAYDSGAFSFAQIGSVPHGLGQQPGRFQIMMRCVTTDVGYAVGDEVDISSFYGSSSSPTAFSSDATGIYWAFNLASPLVLNKSTGAGAVITPARWNLRVRAWR